MKIRTLVFLMLLLWRGPSLFLRAEPADPIPRMMGTTYKISNPESTGTCFFIARPAEEAGKTESSW